MWKICIFPKLKLSEHHLVSSFFKLIPNQPNQPNNPTQPHLGKPRPVQVHNHQISNHHPKWRALKIPVLDHISISKRWRRCHQRHCLGKKNMVFLGKKKQVSHLQKTGGSGKKNHPQHTPSPQKKREALQPAFAKKKSLNFGVWESRLSKSWASLPKPDPFGCEIATKVAQREKLAGI